MVTAQGLPLSRYRATRGMQALVLDLYVRRPVGWARSLSPDSTLTKKALRMAYESRGERKGVVFHSNQGCQYTSLEYRQQL
jgi:putative transposase